MNERIMGSKVEVLMSLHRKMQIHLEKQFMELAQISSEVKWVLMERSSLCAKQCFAQKALSVQLTNGLLCWLFQVLLLEATLHTLGDGDVPLLDVVAYGGYTFSRGVSGLSGKDCLQILLVYSHIVGMLLHGLFLVKIMKRIL
ncbi:hypothetical protein GH714_018317 [Hevea brasiliensis]|uniref:Uncharacterized protein n=1 Tax=Hevea brasiliensis TaxID=3981 RepID=A0A6A6MEI3_HEVBR|nr:hypothetical protein GH714_018317 [Hevea brasiliensis]